MAKTRRAYTGASVETTTTTAIAASGTTVFTVSAATNWPYGTDPYYVVLSPGTASEEKVLVTRNSSSDLTINIASDAVRGQDGTSAVSHDAGAAVYPVFTAVDADEANELTSMWEAKGDIVSHGTSTFSRWPVGTEEYVLQADSSTASGLAWGQVDTASIANNAVTAAKIDAAAVDTSELAADAVDGTKIADNSIDSEHYVDGSIDTAHIADTQVTYAKLNSDVTEKFPLRRVGQMSFSGAVNGGEAKRAEATVSDTNRFLMIAVSADDVAQFEMRLSTGGTILRTDDTVRGDVFNSHTVTFYSLGSATTFELWNKFTTNTAVCNVTAHIIDLGPS